MKPLNSLVLVCPIAEQQEQSGLIIMNRKEAFEKAKVLAVPSSKEPMEFAVGDIVLVMSGIGIPMPNGRLVNKSDILAVIE
jgi:co-chaperonin GroES (HSP10)